MYKVRLVLTAAVASATFAATSVVAFATPDTVEEARQELERIQEEASTIDQEIIDANNRVAVAEEKLVQLQADLEVQEARVAELGAQLGDIATIQMQSDSVSLTAQLLTSADSDRFLSGLGVIQSETDRSNAQLQELQLGEAKVAALRQEAVETEAKLKADRDAKVAFADQFDEKEAEAQAVYNRLSQEERERLAALEAERVAAADAEVTQAATSASTQSSAAPTTTSASTGEGSGRAQQAVQLALAQVGKSYVWGAAGPNSFDCSGLMIYAYKSVGISLPRVASAQASSGYAVSRSELQPGDLVFYYPGITHVGMYIGNGQIVHAGNPRSGVKVDSVSSMPFHSARRVVG